MTLACDCIILELPHIVGIIGFFTEIGNEPKILLQETSIQSRIGALHNIGITRGGPRGPCPPKIFRTYNHFMP